jgi:hypothetical protein
MAWGDITLPTDTWADLPQVGKQYIKDQNGDYVTDQNGNKIEIQGGGTSWVVISTPVGTYVGMGYNFLVTTALDFLVTVTGIFLVTCYPIMDWSTISTPTDVWSDI